MKRLLVILCGACAIVAAGALYAQSSAADYYVTGTVVSTSPDHLVLSTPSGSQMDFNVDSQTVLPSSMSSGTTVDVKYHETSTGGYQAAEVRTVGASDSAQEPSRTSSSTSEPMKEDMGATAPHDATHKTLPKTADPVVLVGLMGLASLGAGAGLRRFSR